MHVLVNGDRFFAFSTVVIVPVDLLETGDLTGPLTSLWRVLYW